MISYRYSSSMIISYNERIHLLILIMILSVIYLASSRRQKEEIHYNELVKYFRWQPQQDILYFSDHIRCGTAVKKNDEISVSNVHCYSLLYIIIII